MKTTELMIGNIVEIGGEPQQLRHIARRKVGYCPLGSPNRRYAHISEVKPIPITEELLLKNGFKSFDKKRFELRGVKKCTDLFFYYDEQHLPEHWRLLIKNEEVMDLCTAYITHLHQLQNLCNIAGVEMNWEV